MSASLPGVAVVGLGGLGCPAALALARSGAVRLGLFDADRVESSNLPRQLLYREEDLGRWKVEAAAERLRMVAPGCEVETFVGPVADRAADLPRYDLWVDAVDRFDTKLWLFDRARAARRPWIHAGAARLQGQVLEIGADGRPCLRCLAGGGGETRDTCQQLGILGPVAGALGGFMARFALEALAGRGMPGRFLALDAAQGLVREGCFSPQAECRCQPEPASTDATTDVTKQACPLSFVQARLALERLPSGGRLRVLLQGDETLRSLSRSFAEEGHRVASIQPEAAGRYLMIIEKRPNAS